MFRTYSESRDLADPAIYGTTEELLDEGLQPCRKVCDGSGFRRDKEEKGAGAKALIFVDRLRPD